MDKETNCPLCERPGAFPTMFQCGSEFRLLNGEPRELLHQGLGCHPKCGVCGEKLPHHVSHCAGNLRRREWEGNRLRMRGANARDIIICCHALLRRRYRKLPLWSLVGDLTGHGSGYSIEICRSAGLDPNQTISEKALT